jgi:hypothetical protein
LIRQDQAARLSEIIRSARAAGDTEPLGRALDLLSKVLRLSDQDQGVPAAGGDPMTRADAREDGDLRRIRKGRDRCGATRRDGQPCEAPAITDGTVCRRHGGSAPQVMIAARRRQLQMEAYSAECEFRAARGTPGAFDALCKALQARRDLDAFELKLWQLAELRAEVRRLRAERADPAQAP